MESFQRRSTEPDEVKVGLLESNDDDSYTGQTAHASPSQAGTNRSLWCLTVISWLLSFLLLGYISIPKHKTAPEGFWHSTEFGTRSFFA